MTLHEGGSMMFQFTYRIPATLVALTCLFILGSMTACSNNGPIAPGELVINPNPPTLTSPDSENPPEDHPRTDDPEEFSIIPGGDLDTESLTELATTLYYLRESGGGTLSIPLGPDEFAVHIWDANTEVNLAAQAVVVCSGGPTSLLDINGIAVYENVSFPVTVTVYVEGYAMATYVETSANILSFAMQETSISSDAYVFGVSDSLGCDLMRFYSDTMVPDIYYEHASEIDPGFISYEVVVPPFKTVGFSGFLYGKINLGEDPPTPFSPSPLFWMINHFAWDIGPLHPKDHRYYGIQFQSKEGPAGTDSGMAVIPEDIWAEKDSIMKYGRMAAIPQAVFLEDERYPAMGPHIILDGEAPEKVMFNCPWFEPAITPDRIIMSGQIVMPEGGMDIVQVDWHPGSDSPDIEFSGIPILIVSAPFGEGLSYPILSVTDPLGEDSNLVRYEARADDVGPLWLITMDGGTSELDTSELMVPLTWIGDVFQDYGISYRVECIYSFSQSVDDFNEDQIIMMRQEVCFSRWAEPQL